MKTLTLKKPEAVTPWRLRMAEALETGEPFEPLQENTHRWVLYTLCKAYPATFHPYKMKPLKLGIYHDLMAEQKRHGLTEGQVGRFFAAYTSKMWYARGMLAHTHRVDLSGEPVQEVSAAHREDAKNRLAAYEARRRKKVSAGKDPHKQKRTSKRLSTACSRFGSQQASFTASTRVR